MNDPQIVGAERAMDSGTIHRCSHCGAELDEEYINDHGIRRTGRRDIGVEIPEIYDGVLFWACPDCGGTWNDWPRDHHRWATAEWKRLDWQKGNQA